jgi:hypothetical protein
MPFYSLTSSGGLVEAATFAALPATGATGTLYVVTATNTLYRWSGSAYVEVSASPAEVVEGANLAAFPATGAAGKIYVALDTGKAYRWGGSSYVEVSGSDWATISNKPSTFAPSAHAASHASDGSDAVTLAVSQVTGLQTALDGKASSTDSRLSDARTPTSHAGSHAAAGADPITVGTVSGRIVTTTTGGKLSTGTISEVVAGQAVAPSGLTVSPPNVNAGNSPADLIPFSIAYDAATIFSVNAVGDVGTPGVIEAAVFSGAVDATNLTGTILDARLPANSREAAQSFLHPFLTGGL